MKSIKRAIQAADGICGKQKREPEREYRISRYCLSVPCEEGTLLYHTLTGELLLVSAPPEEKNSKTVFDGQDSDELISRWFLVPDGFDERQFADGIAKIAGMLRKKEDGKNSFTILTTTDCNARCFYCYEIGIRKIRMTDETARETAEYILRVSNGKPVSLRWFGGEPLYNRRAIEIICAFLHERGVEFESTMVTNGYLLDGETVKQAWKDWHLRKIQITIDGTREMYNRTKAYVGATGDPYSRVMENIGEAMSAGIRVAIRLNMDARNAQDLCMLADDLAARFPDHRNLEVYVALLQEFNGKIHAHDSLEQAEEDFFAIREKMKGYGLLRKRSLPENLRPFRCMADQDDSEVVLPDGRTGRCEHFSEDIITGNIRDEKRDRKVEQRWKQPLNVPECDDCVLYPVCKKLQMCVWNQESCAELDRRIRIRELKEQMQAAYEEYKRRETEKGSAGEEPV